jgi:hypothetical protein
MLLHNPPRIVHRIIVTLLAGLGLIVATGNAQTIESVLRALQERQMALQSRSAGPVNGNIWSPIVWPSGIEDFPQENTIHSLPQALEALNLASWYFDQIKGEFLCYDTAHNQFVNLEQRVFGYDSSLHNADWIGGEVGDISNQHQETSFLLPHVDLPSVGKFDETNWREKLLILASNITQLKVLGTSLRDARVQTGGYDPVVTNYRNATEVLSWTINFPWAIPPPTSPGLHPQPTAIENQYGGYNSCVDALRWTVTGEFLTSSDDYGLYGAWVGDQMECVVGVMAKAYPIQNLPANAPILQNTFKVFKGASVCAFGDLTEPFAKDESHQLRLGTLTEVPLTDNQDGTFQAGSYTESDGVTTISREDALAASLAWLGVVSPTIHGVVVAAPAPTASVLAQMASDQDTPELSESIFSIASPTQAAQSRRGFNMNTYNGVTYATKSFHGFGIIAYGIMIPKFTQINIPDRAKAVGHVSYGLGDVVESVINRELLQIHVGRGRTDLNQVGWLGTRSDGFGNLTFHGSPDEFEVIYNDYIDDPEDFTDLPLGGPTFDSVQEFDDVQKTKSGWAWGRQDYLASWFVPRLRQVVSRDLFVDIHYTTCYRKELSFYWASEQQDFDGHFYVPHGDPFKKITLENPTASPDAPGLPTEKDHLRINEDDARYREITITETPATANTPRTLKYAFKISDLPDGDTVTHEYTRSDDNFDIKVKRVQDGLTTNTTYSLSEWGFPTVFTDEAGRSFGMEKISMEGANDPGQKREITFDSNYGTMGLKKITYSGPSDWSEHDREITFGAHGMLAEDKRQIAGKELSAHYDWSGGQCVAYSTLGGSEFSRTTANYSPDFTQVIKITSGRMTTLTYEGQGATSSIPGSLIRAVYPGGYTQSFSILGEAFGIVTEMREAWEIILQTGRTRLLRGHC